MAELNEDEIRRLAPAFLEAFNRRSGTRYRMEDFRDPTDRSADLYFVSPEFGDLKVQWTTPPMDESEKQAIAQLHRFRDDVVAALTEAELRGAIIGLQIRAIPSPRSERLRVLSAVVRLVQAVRDAHGGGYSQTTIPSWQLSRYEGGLAQCFDEIDVIANSNPKAAPCMFGGPSIASLVPSTSSRAESALVHKAALYGPSARDLVLVVHFDMDVYDHDDIEDVRMTLKHQADGFKQVWILRDPAIGLPTAHWVKGEPRPRTVATR